MRPLLTERIGVEEFLGCYWLKTELVEFCQQQNIPVRGRKPELTARIAAYLRGQQRQGQPNTAPARRRPTRAPAQRKRRSAVMPAQFTLDTVIGEGWRCSQELRAFFAHELGAPFAFDQTMRALIQSGDGKTLRSALETWLEQRLGQQHSG